MVHSFGFFSRASSDLHHSHVTESADFTEVLVGAVAGCLTFSSVCLSVGHALRDVLMALHELLDELFARVRHGSSRDAWSAGLTSTTVLPLRALRVKVCDVRAQVLWFRIHVVLLLWWSA